MYVSGWCSRTEFVTRANRLKSRQGAAQAALYLLDLIVAGLFTSPLGITEKSSGRGCSRSGVPADRSSSVGWRSLAFGDLGFHEPNTFRRLSIQPRQSSGREDMKIAQSETLGKRSTIRIA